MFLKNRIKIDYHLILVLLVPVVLLLASQEWFFPYSGGPTDGWFNDIYFYGYGKLPQLFGVYKAARLSWILKGWLVQHLFSPLVGYYVLNLFILYACIIPFYYITKLLFNRSVAVLATLAFATYSQFHSIISFEWDYHTHDATANIVLTLLLLLLATRRPRWKLYLFLAGTTCVSAFQSPFVMICGLSVIFWYCFLNRQGAKHSLLTSAWMFGVGGVTMVAIYGAINVAAGGSFLYMLTQIPGHGGWPGLAAYAYQKSYWQPVGEMLLHNQGIIVPLFSALFSIVALFYLLKKKPDHPYRNSIFLCLMAYLSCFPVFVIFQALGWPVLNLQHWIIGMDQFVFLAMAGLFAVFLPDKELMHNRKASLPILIFSFVVLLGALVLGLKTVSHIFIIEIICWLAVIAFLWTNRSKGSFFSQVAWISGIFAFSRVMLYLQDKMRWSIIAHL